MSNWKLDLKIINYDQTANDIRYVDALEKEILAIINTFKSNRSTSLYWALSAREFTECKVSNILIKDDLVSVTVRKTAYRATHNYDIKDYLLRI